MRSHCALYVDAGYLLASAATLMTGTSLRSGINVNHERLINALVDKAEASSGLPLLRVNWYDSASRGIPDETQNRIGLLPRVKLRLGRVGWDGEQKGVDLRIGLDMVAHARNGAVDAIFLVSGDDDLTEAVEEAQGHGVQVIVLGVPNQAGRAHAVSRHLQRESDGLEVLDAAVITENAVRADVPAKAEPTPSTTVDTPTSDKPTAPTPALLAGKKPLPPATTTPPPRPQDVLVYSSATGAGGAYVTEGQPDHTQMDQQISKVVDQVLNTYLRGAGPVERAALTQARPMIPREVDRALLHDLCELLETYDLDDTTRNSLRSRFWRTYDEQHADSARPATVE
ncbi:MAG: NYN domain-containing protein [Marmoricola sp.]